VAAVLYILSIIAANLTVDQFIEFPFGILVSVGTLFFGATFTLRDYMHQHHGRQYVYLIIGLALVCNVLVAAWTGTPMRFIVAGFLAIAVSEFADTEVYQRLRRRNWYVRVLASNSVSIPLDSTIFTVLAFAGIMTMGQMVGIIVGDIIIKGIIGLLLAFVRDTPIYQRLVLTSPAK